MDSENFDLQRVTTTTIRPHWPLAKKEVKKKHEIAKLKLTADYLSSFAKGRKEFLHCLRGSSCSECPVHEKGEKETENRSAKCEQNKEDDNAR
ncbi:hypothetical protein TYRP_013209 [Tyrophagus putrescentiae]|nr:hypothetical protein TYRP_013209 [Tyrophagus putrescentiae]